MSLATLLLFCLFLFACVGLTGRTAWRLRVQEGAIAAFALVLLALSAFPVALSDDISLSCASLLLFATALRLCRGVPDIVEALLCAVPAGALGWCLYSLVPFYEAGALLAVPAALIPRLLLRRKRTALLAAVTAPLVFGLCRTLEDWYLFDWRALALGGGVQFDAQIAALFLLALLWYLPVRRRVAVPPRPREAA
jgi:hypothetical protein